jgi:hypothetical protein
MRTYKKNAFHINNRINSFNPEGDQSSNSSEKDHTPKPSRRPLDKNRVFFLKRNKDVLSPQPKTNENNTILNLK